MKITNILQSVLAAFFGVQSQKKYQQDFTQSDSPWPFIAAAVLALFVFLFCVFFFVKVMLAG